MTRIFVSRDSGALSMGAERVAMAIATEAVTRNQAVTVVRNGSRGLYWLEPLVEVETPAGRVAYGPVAPGDVPGLFAAGFLIFTLMLKVAVPIMLGEFNARVFEPAEAPAESVAT